MTTEAAERLASLETSHAAHIKSDDERYIRIENTTAQILSGQTEIGRKLDAAIARVHDRIDDVEGKSRHAINNAAQVAHIETANAAREATLQTKAAMDTAYAVQAELSALEPRIKFWAVSGVATIAVGVIAWLGDHFLWKP